jgi:hypothetical protein
MSVSEVDPLLCPKCRQPMSVIAFIRDGAVIDKILNHLQYRFDLLSYPSENHKMRFVREFLGQPKKAISYKWHKG